MTVTVAEVRHARRAGADVVRRTPVLASQTLSERSGGTVVLKAEYLQRTGSFKIRGALNKLDALGDERAAGVVGGSAGNHAQALAAAARARGVPCEVFMPADAPIAKVEAARGARARGASSSGAVGRRVPRAPRASAPREARAGVRPPVRRPRHHRRAGHARPRAARGRRRTSPRSSCRSAAAGWPAASRSRSRRAARRRGHRRPGRGVRAVPASLAAGQPVDVDPPLDDRRRHRGQAARRDHAAAARALARRGRDGRARTRSPTRWSCCSRRPSSSSRGPARSAWRRCSAARSTGAARARPSSCSRGGNVDAGLLAAVARRHETEPGRRIALITRVPDRPGRLARLLNSVGRRRAPTWSRSSTCARASTCTSARRRPARCSRPAGRDHAQDVMRAIADAGYDARVLR